MAGRVQDKVAIVTGAGSIGAGLGNGKAAAIVYAREGAKVVAVDCRVEAAEETRDLIANEGGECLVMKADVSKAKDCKAIVDKCIEVYKRIDILHNNVGIAIPGGPVETSEETWDKVFDVNLKSMYLMCKYVLPVMEKQGSGSVINISSIAGMRAIPYPDITYITTKAGNIALTTDIAVHYAPKGIRVNTISPGYIDTPMVVKEVMYTYSQEVEDGKRKRAAMVPMGRQGTAWDVAYAALFLASDEAKYITGANLVVDGGLSCIFFNPASLSKI
jgi:NAD(P)-dependent dehydrogenase (short-subunit alcohol dehydrogenase family)